MLAIAVYLILAAIVTLLILFGAFTWYVFYYHFSHIERGLEAKPLFFADSGEPLPDALPLSLRTKDGRKIVGSYLPHTGSSRRGIILFSRV